MPIVAREHFNVLAPGLVPLATCRIVSWHLYILVENIEILCTSMSGSEELIWFLVRPWVRDEDLTLTTRDRHAQGHAELVARHNGPARARVLRALVRGDCHLVLPGWLERPLAQRRVLRNGRVHASEGEWLLDYARAAAAYRCAESLQKMGYGADKGSKTRGGRQGRWRAWL